MLKRTRTILLTLALAIPGASIAEEVDRDTAIVKVTGYLATMAANERAQLCFAHVKVMMLGYESKQKGLSIEDFVELDVFSAGSDEYRLFEAGRGMSGHLDKTVDDYFSSCLDESLEQALQ